MNPAFQPDSRQRNLEQLGQGCSDVLILGGGINGAGVARDLALRAQQAGMRLRISLIDRHHFATGPSGKNSQLIHGGLRYLKRLELKLVREALRERDVLLSTAPHLVEPLPFLIPFYGNLSRAFYGCGLWLYDVLAGNHRIQPWKHLSAGEVARVEPGLNRRGLSAAGIYYDCQVHSARLVLENIFDAARMGVVAANYLYATGWKRTGDVFEVEVTDELSGRHLQVRTRHLVDATGPWQKAAPIRLVRGSHLILPRLGQAGQAIAHFLKDGRILFIIPWGPGKQYSLVGTTDADHSAGPEDVRISRAESAYLLQGVRELFPDSAPPVPLAAYSSLRPLIQEESASATATSREHRIWKDQEGIVHIAGGKYTTYRAMCEQAVDLLCEALAPSLAGRCRTQATPIGGNSRERLAELLHSTGAVAAQYGLEREEAAEALKTYGNLAGALWQQLPGEAPEGMSRLETARLRFAVSHEMAQRLSDFALVSSYDGYQTRTTAESLRPVALEMARLLDWDSGRVEEEIRLTREVAAPAANSAGAAQNLSSEALR